MVQATPAAPAFDAVVIGASAGGIAALGRVLVALPPDFPAPVIVVQHLSPFHPSALAELLQRRCDLAVRWARTGDPLAPRTVYLAPRARHLVVTRHGCELSDAPCVHFARPAADVLFTSAARAWGPRALGVVLTGAGTDGAAGARAVKEGGGVVIAQDEATSAFFSMPGTAIRRGNADFVLPLDAIPAALVTLVMVPGARSLFQTGRAKSVAA